MSPLLAVLRLLTAGVAVACAVVLGVGGSEKGREGRLETGLLNLALLLHLAILAGRAYAVRYFPLQTPQDVLVLLSLLILGIYRFGRSSLWSRRVGIPICLVSTILILLSALGRTPDGTPGELRSVMLPIHVLGATVAYACFTVNLILYVYLLVRWAWSRGQPDWDRTRAEKAARRFGVVGLGLYGVFVMGMGMVWARIAWGRFWGWDPKETMSLVTFCVYALYVYFEVVIRPKSRALRGALAAIAYLALILTFVLGILLAELH